MTTRPPDHNQYKPAKDMTKDEQNSLSISRIFCSQCKKPFKIQIGMLKDGITTYTVKGKITGVSYKEIKPIKKISFVSGHPVEKEIYTLKFACKDCYNRA